MNPYIQYAASFDVAWSRLPQVSHGEENSTSSPQCLSDWSFLPMTVGISGTDIDESRLRTGLERRNWPLSLLCVGKLLLRYDRFG